MKQLRKRMFFPSTMRRPPPTQRQQCCNHLDSMVYGEYLLLPHHLGFSFNGVWEILISTPFSIGRPVQRLTITQYLVIVRSGKTCAWILKMVESRWLPYLLRHIADRTEVASDQMTGICNRTNVLHHWQCADLREKLNDSNVGITYLLMVHGKYLLPHHVRDERDDCCGDIKDGGNQMIAIFVLMGLELGPPQQMSGTCSKMHCYTIETFCITDSAQTFARN